MGDRSCTTHEEKGQLFKDNSYSLKHTLGINKPSKEDKKTKHHPVLILMKVSLSFSSLYSSLDPIHLHSSALQHHSESIQHPDLLSVRPSA